MKCSSPETVPDGCQSSACKEQLQHKKSFVTASDHDELSNKRLREVPVAARTCIETPLFRTNANSRSSSSMNATPSV
eukprot:2760142-Amphidinium_carterae.1